TRRRTASIHTRSSPALSMSAQPQQRTSDAEALRAPVHPDAHGTGGTGSVADEARQPLTVWEEQRALTANLREQVCDPQNLIRAYRRVRRNKGTPGVDGMTVLELVDWLREHQAALTASLRDGSYQPQPVRGVEIPKPGGGKRQLGIPTASANCTGQQIAFRMGRNLPSFPSASWSALPNLEETPNSRH